MRVPGARRLSNGVIETDTVRLVGKWDGRALNLTESPRRATPPRPAPSPVAAEATPRAVAAGQRMAGDSPELQGLGIYILKSWTDGDAVVALVPVADQRTVTTLRQRYGPVVVNAWLQRA
jgi:hypothetical protein